MYIRLVSIIEYDGYSERFDLKMQTFLWWSHIYVYPVRHLEYFNNLNDSTGLALYNSIYPVFVQWPPLIGDYMLTAFQPLRKFKNYILY